MSEFLALLCGLLLLTVVITGGCADCTMSYQCDEACSPYVVKSYGKPGCICADVDGGETFKRRHP